MFSIITTVTTSILCSFSMLLLVEDCLCLIYCGVSSSSWADYLQAGITMNTGYHTSIITTIISIRLFRMQCSK